MNLKCNVLDVFIVCIGFVVCIVCIGFLYNEQKLTKELLANILFQMKLIGPSFNIVFYFCTNRYICLLSTTSLKIALFMDNKLRLNIAGPGQEINDPKSFAQ